MALKYALVLILAIIAFGCITPPPPPPGDNVTSNTTVNVTGPEVDEDALAVRHNCDMGVRYWGDTELSSGKVRVYECVSEEKYDAIIPQEYIYMIDMHPLGAGLVTYILVSDTEQKISSTEGLQAAFAPISSGETAHDYIVLSRGLWVVDSVDQAPLEKGSITEKDGKWEIKVLYGSNNVCPCYGGYYSTTYLVSPSGDTEMLDHKILYSYGPEQTGCIC